MLKKHVIVSAAVVALLTAGVAFAQDKKVSNTEALLACQKTLKRASLDPETAVVPDVGAMRGGTDWRFLWNQNSRLVRVKNGVGLEVGVIALCVVDEGSGQIKLLTLDGKQLIAPGKSL